ncbi:MAG TPA: twin-arginine translocation signal domain-containing protein, partial [Chromatiaceae bacterium]|nr:twin-arginine translocation signal domain-containing protein [Chromatiaceae bacterium]
MSTSNDQGRRDFLKKAAAAASVTIAPGVVLHSLQQAQAEPRTTAVTDQVRWGMLIDTSKCVEGCNDCVAACDSENGIDLVDKPEGA